MNKYTVPHATAVLLRDQVHEWARERFDDTQFCEPRISGNGPDYTIEVLAYLNEQQHHFAANCCNIACGPDKVIVRVGSEIKLTALYADPDLVEKVMGAVRSEHLTPERVTDNMVEALMMPKSLGSLLGDLKL